MNRHSTVWVYLVLLMLGNAVQAADSSNVAAAQVKPADKQAPSDSTQKTVNPTKSDAARSDQLTLDATVVTGNRELPKVMYIVPWKKADLGTLPAQPLNTLLNEVMQPVDREVFQREVSYYAVVAGKDQAPAVEQATQSADSK